MMAKRFKVYVKKLSSGVQVPMKIIVIADDKDDARLGAQMMMRKRFNKELNRDYRISKTLEEKK
jgi:hypothetical protein